MKILISLGHREQPWPHPHHTDCSYTRKSHEVPRSLNRPSKSRAYSFDFCRPTNKIILNKLNSKQTIKSWQTMWLHPPSFSMVTLHLGHSFVLAAIQLDVSESSSHFLIHLRSRRHCTGSCHCSPHSKQKMWPHLHSTGRGSTYCTFMAKLQSAEGHQRSKRLHYNRNRSLHESNQTIFYQISPPQSYWWSTADIWA